MTLLKRITILAFILPSLYSFAQEAQKTVVINNDTIIITAIPLNEISNNTEKVYKEIKTIRDKINSYDDQQSIDSLTDLGRRFINEGSSALYQRLGSLTEREILDAKKDWEKVNMNLESWKLKFNSRSSDVENLVAKTDLMLRQWTLSLEQANIENAVEQLKISIQNTLKDITDINNEVRNKQNQIYLNQNNITEFKLEVDDIINLLDLENSALRLTYLNKDRPSIWAMSDSIGNIKTAENQYRIYLKKSKNDLAVFFQDYYVQLIFQSLLLIILLVLIFYLNRIAFKFEDNNADISTAKKVTMTYLITAIFLTLYSSVWFYPIRPSVINEILRFGMLIASFFYFPFLFSKKSLFKVVFSILTIFFFSEILIVLDGRGLFSRIFVYFEALAAGLMLLFLFKQTDRLKNLLKLSYWNIFNYLVPLFILMLVVATIGNTFGYVDLSMLLIKTVTNAIFNVIILIMLTLTLNSIVVLSFQTKFLQKSNIIKEHKSQILYWFTSAITIITIIYWFNAIIKDLGFNKIFWEWINGIFEISWKVSNTTISLGVIITVILIIAIIVAVVRIVGVVLNKEIFPRVRLPRGVPGAISMVIKYTIVGFGIYFVLSAAGIDLGKFGLIAGALGVGIGFGLQNIVYNFIAGLVLAFERPIQVGDVIEVGSLMGTVTSIGVRASNVETFDGSDVIVPNGNLISKELINWTLSDRKKRRDIQVGVAYGSDPHQVMEILLKAASEHVNVLETPSPWATFEGFGESSLNFKIRFWVPFDIGLSTKSQVAMSIYDALEEAGIKIPFPQRDLYIKSIDKDYKDVTEQDIKMPGFKKDASDDDQKPKIE